MTNSYDEFGPYPACPFFFEEISKDGYLCCVCFGNVLSFFRSYCYRGLIDGVQALQQTVGHYVFLQVKNIN